ncbi:MAG: glycosyltransferase family 2 protein, partial [Gemmataceae bacterium]
MLLLKMTFWICAVCVVYTYAAYPLLLWVLARWRGHAVCAKGPSPRSVSLLVAAHNEEQAVSRRLQE